jgi:MtN3 and saliva related transmembrane protein
MEGDTLLGMLAGILTTSAFLPQLVKAWRSRSTRDISLAMYVIISSGMLLWLVYGLLIGSLPLILANTVTLAIAVTILILKIKYR